jgi:hypothetical protein
MAADVWTFPPTADSARFLLGYEIMAINGRVGTIEGRADLSTDRTLQRIWSLQRFLWHVVR